MTGTLGECLGTKAIGGLILDVMDEVDRLPLYVWVMFHCRCHT